MHCAPHLETRSLSRRSLFDTALSLDLRDSLSTLCSRAYDVVHPQVFYCLAVSPATDAIGSYAQYCCIRFPVLDYANILVGLLLHVFRMSFQNASSTLFGAHEKSNVDGMSELKRRIQVLQHKPPVHRQRGS